MKVIEVQQHKTVGWLEGEGIGKYLKELAGDDAIQIIFYGPLKETMEKIVASENCEIVKLDGDTETLKATIKKKRYGK